MKHEKPPTVKIKKKETKKRTTKQTGLSLKQSSAATTVPSPSH